MKIIDKIFVRDSFSDLYPLLLKYDKVFCIYDNNVLEYSDEIANKATNIAAELGIDATEENKNIKTVVQICQFLLENDADRASLVLSVGGGITSDLVGFSASIYKRGIKFGYVPTTLLSQVDAAIGGKTGANLESYKNIIGTIIQPEFTYSNVMTLRSLSRRDFMSGAVEMLKTFIIKDEGYYQKTIDYFSGYNGKLSETNTISYLISAAANIKAYIVEKDEFEHGERRLLNLGHTFAHAIEWHQQTHDSVLKYTHGEAVAIGLVQAAKLSMKLGMCDDKLPGQIENDLKHLNLHTEMPCDLKLLVDAIFKDKKMNAKGVDFVIINQIGNVGTYTLNKNDFEKNMI